ncbi:hypothetical protein KSP39_PZI014802 [Platanthera zijinensis]|uniref:Uncharacterized protein n=1 Tax=Platanthera zijinensis TaxID=2320716 RepID=A0AAP0G1Y0_9ASPA
MTNEVERYEIRRPITYGPTNPLRPSSSQLLTSLTPLLKETLIAETLPPSPVPAALSHSLHFRTPLPRPPSKLIQCSMHAALAFFSASSFMSHPPSTFTYVKACNSEAGDVSILGGAASLISKGFSSAKPETSSSFLRGEVVRSSPPRAISPRIHSQHSRPHQALRPIHPNPSPMGYRAVHRARPRIHSWPHGGLLRGGLDPFTS